MEFAVRLPNVAAMMNIVYQGAVNIVAILPPNNIRTLT